jgi:RpiB/LacA/LacB family sugar-phosphate isomerase
MNGYEEYKHVVLGSDHAGFKLKGKIGEFLFGHGLEICDMVPVYHEGILFPDVAKSVCKKVANCSRTLGILVCGTGIGMTIAANRHTGIYAALLYDDFTSELCRRHNNECINIKSVYIPASVYDIHGGAFSACSSLESYYLDNANTTYTSIDGVLFTKDKSVLISYPGGRNGDYEIRTGTTEIGEFAFYNCEYLTSITIPDTVSAINEYAFSECNNLININIPDSITYIGEYAFSNAPLTGISDNSVSVLKRLYKGNDDRWYENIMYSKKNIRT